MHGVCAPSMASRVVTSYLPARIFAGIEKQDLERQSLYSIFEHNYKRKLQWAEEVIGAMIAGAEEADALQTSAGSALLVIRETTYDAQSVAIEYSLSLLRGDRYTASVISVRKKLKGDRVSDCDITKQKQYAKPAY